MSSLCTKGMVILLACGLSACSSLPVTCNTRDWLAPDDYLVAMVDGLYPKRYITNSFEDSYAPTLWLIHEFRPSYVLDGVCYVEREISYATPRRPVIRYADGAGVPLHISEMWQQFPVDASIPAERWLQPIATSRYPKRAGVAYRCIPQKEFAYKSARALGEVPTEGLMVLAELPIQDRNTYTFAHRVAQAPLWVVDAVADVAMLVTAPVWSPLRSWYLNHKAERECVVD